MRIAEVEKAAHFCNSGLLRGNDARVKHSTLFNTLLTVPEQMGVVSQKIAADTTDSSIAVMAGAHEGLESPLQFLVLRRVDCASFRALEHFQREIPDVLGRVLNWPHAMFLKKVREPEIRGVGIEDLAKRQVSLFTIGPHELGDSDTIQAE